MTPKKMKKARVGRCDVSPYYQKIWDACPSRSFRNAVWPFVVSIIALQIATLTDLTMDIKLAVEADLAARGWSNARSRVNSAISRLNQLGKGGLDIPEITPLENAKTRYAKERAGFPPDVWREVEAFLSMRAHDSSLTTTGLRNAMHKAIKLNLDARRQVATASDLITEDSLNFIGEHSAFGGLDHVSATRKVVLNALGAFAKYLGDAAAVELASAINRAALNGNWRLEIELSLDLLLRLVPFEDPSVFDRLLQGYATTIGRFVESGLVRGDLPNAQDALGAVIICAKPLDRNDLVALAFTGPSRQTPWGERPLLALSGDGLFEQTLTPTIQLLVDRLYFKTADAIGRPPVVLFEKARGGVRDASTIGKGVAATTRRLGHRFSISELKVLGVFVARQARPQLSDQALAGIARIQDTEHFRRRFRAMLARDASQRFADALNLDETITWKS